MSLYNIQITLKSSGNYNKDIIVYFNMYISLGAHCFLFLIKLFIYYFLITLFTFSKLLQVLLTSLPSQLHVLSLSFSLTQINKHKNSYQIK